MLDVARASAKMASTAAGAHRGEERGWGAMTTTAAGAHRGDRSRAGMGCHDDHK
jgi:hypothetical protein